MKEITCEKKFVPEVGNKIVFYDSRDNSTIHTITSFCRFVEEWEAKTKGYTFGVRYLFWDPFQKVWVYKKCNWPQASFSY